jgi:hypothetical protein
MCEQLSDESAFNSHPLFTARGEKTAAHSLECH